MNDRLFLLIASLTCSALSNLLGGCMHESSVEARISNEQPEFLSIDEKTCESPIQDRIEGTLGDVIQADLQLEQYFQKSLIYDLKITRQLVSFQANKKRSNYRWYKYKEGFSADLVQRFIKESEIKSVKILDPFAGSGTTLFVASLLGIKSVGIELLPIGEQIIRTRKILEDECTSEDFERLKKWIDEKPWLSTTTQLDIPVLRITKGAYPIETLQQIQGYLGLLKNENSRVQAVLQFALLCVLESVSYTRKDGQYLRWDFRSGRSQGDTQFNKGKIEEFTLSITNKLEDILSDVSLSKSVNENAKNAEIEILKGSCLELLPSMMENQFDLVITSPPYCNRYDYTRTYALELAMLGICEEDLLNLRQNMLSCTVENRAKDLLFINPNWKKVIELVDSQELLQNLLTYFHEQKELGLLNNNGIPRMIRGYFYEMACIIYELYRVLMPNGKVYMVNDNVRYAGASVSVDLILSKIAEDIGFVVEKIVVLPKGKGNSSQQMGVHGRVPLRKCIYVWKKG